MGAGQSRPQSDEKVFQSETPIQFSPDVVNQLSDNLETTETPPQRQTLIDAHIRARIKGELETLKREEEDVRRQIEAALEKENLDKERSMSADDGSASAAGDVKTSAALFGDLNEVKQKIEKYHAKKDISAHPEIQSASEAVIQCYRQNASTSLDCWREVQHFKASVGRLEQDYLRSL